MALSVDGARLSVDWSFRMTIIFEIFSVAAELLLCSTSANWPLQTAITLLLNSFSLVPLLVGICAEMDNTSSLTLIVWISAGLAPPKDGRNSDGACYE